MTTLAAVIGRDILANRPAAGTPGRLFEATDTTPPTVYRDNGTSWDTYATAGAGTVTTTRGDLIRRGASADERLAVGAANRLLRSDGTDPAWGQVVEADLNLTDVTTADVSTTKHGLAPKAPNDVTKFLNGTGAWSAPAGGGGGSGGGLYFDAALLRRPTYAQAPNATYPGIQAALNGTADGASGANEHLTWPGAFDGQTSAAWTGTMPGCMLWHRDGTDMPAGYVDVKFDLGAAKAIYRVLTIGAWNNGGSVRHPAEYHVYSSDDGTTYTERGTALTGMASNPGTLSNAPWYLDMDLSGAPITARYWRVRLYPGNTGGDDWLAVHRVRLFGVISTLGAAGGGWPLWMDHAARLRLLPYGTGAYANQVNLTDGDPATTSNSTTGIQTQQAQVDLGDSPPQIGTVHVLYADSGHRSVNGSLDWSDDASAWTSVATWTGDATLDRWFRFTPATHRYWRLASTAAGGGGNGIDIKLLAMYDGRGTDRAYGIVPTSNGSHSGIANATDGGYATSAVATAAPVPAHFAVDLGAAYPISYAHFVFRDNGHSPITGSLQWSDDNSTWTDAVAWSNEYGTERFWTLPSGPLTHRYWRLRVTSIASAAGLDVNSFELIDVA